MDPFCSSSICDIDECVMRFLKFADDTKLFGSVTNFMDNSKIQEDLENPFINDGLRTGRCHLMWENVMHFGACNSGVTCYMKRIASKTVEEESDLQVMCFIDSYMGSGGRGRRRYY